MQTLITEHLVNNESVKSIAPKLETRLSEEIKPELSQEAKQINTLLRSIFAESDCV